MDPTRLRVALVAPDCNKRDGQARYVAELAEGLSDRGHSVEVFSVTFEDTDPVRVGHRAVRAPRHAAHRRFLPFLWRASRAVRERRFDIVHAVGASCWNPDVVTFQFCQAGWDAVLRELPGHALAGGPLDAATRAVIAGIEGRLLGQPTVARVIAVSERTADEVRRHYHWQRPIDVIPNGVDLERFHPRLRRERGDRSGFRIAFLGEFERKNLATAIRALSLLETADATLVAAGRSDPEPFRALARALGVSDRVTLVPATDQPERFLAAADALVFPTLYEPFGMVPLEAMACATPVVVSRRAGFAGWLEDGVHGHVLDDPVDPHAMAARLDRLAADPAAAVATARAGRQLAERFGWGQVVTDTERVYAATLAARR